MKKLNELYKSDDWKNEKHVPVINISGNLIKNEFFQVEVSVGKEIPHPNQVAHHIRWIELYFLPDGSDTPQHVSTFSFNAHGEDEKEEDKGIFTHSCGATCMRTDKSGTLMASAYCNIHGLWQSAIELKVESVNGG